MPPGDGRIPCALEMRIGDALADRLVNRDQSIVASKPREDREVALRDAEGHIGACDLAPLGDDTSGLDDDARRAAARDHRADDLAPRPLLVPLDRADIAAVRIIET